MKQLKRVLCAICLIISLALHAQEGEKGIQWTNGLSWEQIKLKAKAENKYIFVDAYATWCGPCKMMDKYVYPNDTVGDFFNEHFIPVKVQMDATDRDDESIKAWYNDANTIKEECMVESYPTFIFFTPDGKIVQKESRYFPVKEFVALGKEALTPGKTYDDPYPAYKRLVDSYKGFVEDYKQGINHYDLMPAMVRVAWQLNEADFARQLLKDHVEYSATLDKKERYTKENIELWSSYLLRLDSKALQFFLKDGEMIDQVIGQKDWSANHVNNTIQKRIVDSFFKMQKGETRTWRGVIPNSQVMFEALPDTTVLNPDLVEADWKNLEKMIRKLFDKKYTGINVFFAKVRWYYQHDNIPGYSKAYFNMLDKYPPGNLASQSSTINVVSFQTFRYVTDKKLLNKALAWMDKVVRLGKASHNMLDTYANLLYKLGRTKEAIDWEEKAVSKKTELYGNKYPNEFEPIVEKMKKGEPTYLEQGAIWLNK